MSTQNEKLNRFERLAEKRVTEAIKKLRLVGNLANRHNYCYDDEHVEQILDAVETEVKSLRARFRNEGRQTEVTFAFRQKKNSK